MDRKGLLKPVYFLKISHHGSKNGSSLEQIDKVFPAQPHDGRRRVSVVSTAVGAYPGVPDDDSPDLLEMHPPNFTTRVTSARASGMISCLKDDRGSRSARWVSTVAAATHQLTCVFRAKRSSKGSNVVTLRAMCGEIRLFGQTQLYY